MGNCKCLNILSKGELLIMQQFNNLQEGLKFAFNGHEFHIISLPNNPNPYFIGLELVPIFNIKDSSYITRYLNDNEYVIVDYREFPPIIWGEPNKSTFRRKS